MAISDEYAAGLIDGEGYVALRRAPTRAGNWLYRPEIRVGMTHFGAVRALHEHFGVGSVYEKRSGIKAHYLPQIYWTTVSRGAYVVAKRIRPYALVKAEPLDAILAYYESGPRPRINHPGKRGMGNSQAKLTDAQVLEIRALLEDGIQSHREIGLRFGVDKSCVGQIARGLTWRHLLH